MMDITSVRGAIIGFSATDFKAQFPNVPIVWGNAPFDYNSPPDVYAEASVEFEDSEQLGFNSALTRHYGNVYFSIVTRHGLGTGVASACLTWLLSKYQYAIIGGHQLGKPTLTGESPTPRGYEVNGHVPLMTRPL